MTERIARIERITDDLLSMLIDQDDQPWTDVVEDAMNTAWYRLRDLGGSDE